MENIDFATLFQGIGTMMASGWVLASARVFLVLLGLLLIYLGWKGILEPMVMIPMGLGMVAINCGTLIMPDGTLGNLFLDPMLSDTDQLMNTMQIDFLQPVYTLTFSNGLIACFVFMGIGTLLDVGFLLQETICKYIPGFVRRAGHFSDSTYCFCSWSDSERKCICGYGGWSRRTNGVVYFVGIGKASLCSYYGGCLSLFGLNVWRLSLLGKAVGSQTLPRY